MKEFLITKNDAGQRLDRFVSKSVPLLPASLAQKYIRLKRVKVGGKAAPRDYKLAAGDVVSMYINDEFFVPPDGIDLYPGVKGPAPDLLYEDDNILLVNKEAGVLCHSGQKGGAKHEAPATLISRIQSYLSTNGEWRPEEENSFAPALCNRIDRNTSGIVIAAKNAEALRVINDKIKQREIDKLYLAAVHGVPDPPSGSLEGYLFKDAVKNRVYIRKESRPGTKKAVTEYRTVATTGRLSLLECKLITGRTHQIRAQLADCGRPLLGDGKYGNGRLDRVYSETMQALCSYKLIFAFKSDAGMLSYLSGREFRVSGVEFVKKNFPDIDILLL